MSKLGNLVTAACLAASPALADGYGLGRPALPEEIAAWDVDVLPDGSGLPEGEGDVDTGDTLFMEKCASCHGDFAEGRGNWPELAGGFGTLDARDPVKTVGSYWPYLSTVWDYVHRSMPYGAAQTLTPDEVYAITAYILYSNDIVEDDFVLSHETFDSVEMPNSDGFIVDDRPETEYPNWRAEPCMENCKDDVEIVMRATSLGVTPTDDAEDGALQTVAEAEEAAPETEAAAEETETASPDAAAPDPALVEAGEKVYRKCKACHQIGEGADNGVGPHLNGVLGRPMAGVDGYRYSTAMQEAGEEGRVWTEEELTAFLDNPRGYMEGTKMTFSGIRDDDDLAAITAYLKAAGE